MTRWIDSPDWRDGRTTTYLIDTLTNALHRSKQLEEVWVSAGLPNGVVNFDEPARLVWMAMIKRAAEQPGKLKELVLQVLTRVPAVRTDVARIFAVEVDSLDWYVSRDRFSARLVGIGSAVAVLDRSGLRNALARIVNDGCQMVAITGSWGSGKSHSKYLIQHVAKDPNVNSNVLVFDVDREWDERLPWTITASVFVERLADRLGGSHQLTADLLTDPTRTARELATSFAGWFSNRLERRRRWIFVDGLDRDDVRPDVHAFVGYLAMEVLDGQLEQAHLIVTGHPGDFAGDVCEFMAEERLDPLNAAHLTSFFSGIAADIDVPLSQQDCTELVGKVLAEANFSDLRRLRQVASAVAHAHFRGVSAP